MVSLAKRFYFMILFQKDIESWSAFSFNLIINESQNRCMLLRIDLIGQAILNALKFKAFLPL